MIRQRIVHPSDIGSESYAMRVTGDCLHPEVKDGDLLHFDPCDRPREGEFVALFYRPEFVPLGAMQVQVKRLVFYAVNPKFWTDPTQTWVGDIYPIVMVEMLNPRRRWSIDPAHLLGVHRCLGPIAASRCRPVPLKAAARGK